MFYGGQESEQSNFSTIELDQISDGPTTRELSSLITVCIYVFLYLCICCGPITGVLSSLITVCIYVFVFVYLWWSDYESA